MVDYRGYPKRGSATLRIEDQNGCCHVAQSEYKNCDYFNEGVPA
jgi:hypothetical protein